MSYGLLLILMVLAAFRLTRLIVEDDFPPIAWMREYVREARPHVRKEIDADGKYEYRWWWLGELVSCHWCASAYVAAGVVGLSTVVVSVPLPVLWWLAVWAGAALIADKV